MAETVPGERPPDGGRSRARSAAAVPEVVTDLLGEAAVLAVDDETPAVDARVRVEGPEADVVDAVGERLPALPLAVPVERALAVREPDHALRLGEDRPPARRLEHVDRDVVARHAAERDPQALAAALDVDSLEPVRQRARADLAGLGRRRVLPAGQREVHGLRALGVDVARLEHVAAAVLAGE